MKMMNKEALLKLLAQEDELVLSQAYLYAKNMVDYGIDITEKWETALEQHEALHKAYIKGRYDEKVYMDS